MLRLSQAQQLRNQSFKPFQKQTNKQKVRVYLVRFLGRSEYFFGGQNNTRGDAPLAPWVWDRAIGLAHTACSTGSEFRIQNRVSPPGG